MAQVLSTPSHSLKEFRILPGYTPTDGNAPNASLKTRLCRRGDDFLYLHVPFLSAAMQAVTGGEMAIALAQLGGIGILPVSQPIDEQCAKVGQVKRFKAGFQTDILTLSPEQPIAEVVEIIHRTGYTTFPVTTSGQFHDQLLGILTDKDFDERRDLDCQVASRMKTDVQAGREISDLKAANELMIRYGRGFLPILSKEACCKRWSSKRTSTSTCGIPTNPSTKRSACSSAQPSPPTRRTASGPKPSSRKKWTC